MRTRTVLSAAAPLALVALSMLRTTASEKPAPKFATEGVAFLEKHCVRCHNDKVKRVDLSLHTFRDDASLVKNRKLWQGVVHAVKTGEMPPATRPRPAQSETDTFLAVVRDTFSRADRDAKPDPGRVTVRRLNRAEYNNTIRDLVGVDFNPAEDFPSDDIGHGFDNIGDVLTLPPVLMERYLAAAEAILGRAITPVPPKPGNRPTIARFLEPAQRGEVNVRPIDQDRGGTLHTLYKLPMGGDYVFRLRAYGETPDGELPRVVMKMDGVELKTHEVKEKVKGRGGYYEANVTLKSGDHRASVSVANPKAADGKERKVFVEAFYLVGPADTRPESHRKLLAVTEGKSKPEQTREVVSRFAGRAYRRPATADEVNRLAALVERFEKEGERWEAAVQLAFQAVLVSPKFLFRVEMDGRPTEPGPHPIDEYQLASRISYFLWSSMPDDELFALAEKKQLGANLDAQVRRMLKDPKATALVENFAMQWLQLRRLKEHSADPKLFPTFNDGLRAAMLKETELFFAEIVREDRSVLDLIDGKYTYVNSTLARHYGIENKLPGGGDRGFGRRGGPRGGAFVRVDLSDTDRAGILTQASVLTVTSNPTRTSPVKRGKWVLEQILGTPLPPPPPDVPELDDKKELVGTLRQQMEQHRRNPSCAGCHAKMDPLGFAFENYDAVGRFRKADGKGAIDASGVLPDGKKFDGPKELREILRGKKDLVARALAEKLLTYALGRGLEHYDGPSVDAIAAAMAKNDYRFSTLAAEIVKSFPFRMRRGHQTP